MKQTCYLKSKKSRKGTKNLFIINSQWQVDTIDILSNDQQEERKESAAKRTQTIYKSVTRFTRKPSEKAEEIKSVRIVTTSLKVLRDDQCSAFQLYESWLYPISVFILHSTDMDDEHLESSLPRAAVIENLEIEMPREIFETIELTCAKRDGLKYSETSGKDKKIKLVGRKWFTAVEKPFDVVVFDTLNQKVLARAHYFDPTEKDGELLKALLKLSVPTCQRLTCLKRYRETLKEHDIELIEASDLHEEQLLQDCDQMTVGEEFEGVKAGETHAIRKVPLLPNIKPSRPRSPSNTIISGAPVKDTGSGFKHANLGKEDESSRKNSQAGKAPIGLRFGVPSRKLKSSIGLFKDNKPQDGEQTAIDNKKPKPSRSRSIVKRIMSSFEPDKLRDELKKRGKTSRTRGHGPAESDDKDRRDVNSDSAKINEIAEGSKNCKDEKLMDDEVVALLRDVEALIVTHHGADETEQVNQRPGVVYEQMKSQRRNEVDEMFTSRTFSTDSPNRPRKPCANSTSEEISHQLFGTPQYGCRESSELVAAGSETLEEISEELFGTRKYGTERLERLDLVLTTEDTKHQEGRANEDSYLLEHICLSCGSNCRHAQAMVSSSVMRQGHEVVQFCLCSSNSPLIYRRI